ncbi:MAG: chemotaxis response regulator protein-glutamate methylesterase [Spirochaetes bacterium]|nr:chemotaxis response regulator protein-glutamate methylesterase [Spirochaetota bacterium]
MSEKIKVLVVDDSALVRKIITDILESDPEIEVVGTANNGKSAIFKAKVLDPDVITMDIEMPIMDGLEALKHIVHTNPKPVIMMSVLTQDGAEPTFRALEYGAVDFIPKPSSILSLTVEEIGNLLINKVKSVYRSKVRLVRKDVAREVNEIVSKPLEVKGTTSRVVAIGTSTGGPSALLSVFKGLPAGFPAPVLVVQHMPEGFTKAFAERLNSSCALDVKEAEDGDEIKPGHGYIAPGHSHMLVEKKGKNNVIRVVKGEKVSGHRPSIDVLFDSVAETYRKECIGVIMTGMGRDGASGILHIRKNGGATIAQNEETSVVYGMNRVAVEMGAIDAIVPLQEIPKKIIEYL